MDELNYPHIEKNTEFKTPIIIEVVDPRKKEGKLNDYTIYTIKGSDREGGFEMSRRFSDFVCIRKYLV